MNATVFVVYLLLAYSPGQVPIGAMFETQAACDANKKEALDQAAKAGLDMQAGCQKVRMLQDSQQGGV